MTKKWFLIYGIALVLLPTLLLIAMRFKSPSEIMTPPSLNGENAEVQKAFEASINDKSGIVLKYPSSGEYRTSFVAYDLDSDNVNEVIVFYTLKSDETTVRVNILDYINGEWESVYDEPGYGSEILSISFDDMNKDGHLEIVCCWNLYDNNTSKVMTVHSVEGSSSKPVSLKTLANQPYNFSDILDLDNDGYDEIFVIWSDTTDKMPKSYAGLLKLTNQNTVTNVGQNVVLDSSVSKYSSLKLQSINGLNVAFIDAFKGDNTMITEIIWWDSERQTLVAPFTDPISLANMATLRSPAILSMDIDNDSIIEVPTNIVTNNIELNTPNGTASGTPIQNSTGNSDSGTLVSLTKWMTLSGNELVEKKSSYVNNNAGYAFILPNNLAESTVAYMTDSGVLTVYSSNDGKTGIDPLFSLVIKDSSEITGNDTYTFRKTYGDRVIFGTLTSAGQAAGFTDNLVESSIIFFEKGAQS